MGFTIHETGSERVVLHARRAIGPIQRQPDGRYLGWAYGYGGAQAFPTQVEAAFFMIAQMPLPKVAGVS